MHAHTHPPHHAHAQNKYTVDHNQELFALGLSDFLGSFFGAFPVAGGFARTAVAVEANQKTQLSAIVAASIVLLAVNFLTHTFYWSVGWLVLTFWLTPSWSVPGQCLF